MHPQTATRVTRFRPPHPFPGTTMRIAVVGSGIAGLTAAHCLDQRHDVTLFEADARAGGHANTVTLETPQGPLAIDTGFIVCNPVNYPHFFRLVDSLGVALQDTDMSLGVSVAGGRIEWAGDDDLTKIFAQPGLMASPSHLRMLVNVLRFNKHVKRLLAEDRLPDITLGEFLERHRYPMALRVRYVAAMAGPIWSTSTAGVMRFPFPAFARFFESHGLLNVHERPQWRTVVGGSRSYVRALVDRLRARVRLSTPVRHLVREADGVVVHTDGARQYFDAVVCATHSDQALAMLDVPSVQERDILSNVRFTANRAVLHSDTTLMPRRRRAWSSWNALLVDDALSEAPIGVSYWMNRLQRLPGATPYVLSLNPPRDPAPETVHYETEYMHPLYTPETMRAQQALPAIQGSGGIWWAGAWTGYGFHEDGLLSGLRAARAIDAHSAPQWTEAA